MSPIRMSRIEATMRIALDYYAAITKHDAGAALQLIGEDCVFETSEPVPNGTVYSGKKEISTYLKQLVEDLTQNRFEIEDIYGVGKHCVLFWRYLPAGNGNNTDHIRGVDIFQVNDGYIQEIKSYEKGSRGHGKSL